MRGNPSLQQSALKIISFHPSSRGSGWFLRAREIQSVENCLLILHALKIELAECGVWPMRAMTDWLRRPIRNESKPTGIIGHRLEGSSTLPSNNDMQIAFGDKQRGRRAYEIFRLIYARVTFHWEKNLDECLDSARIYILLFVWCRANSVMLLALIILTHALDRCTKTKR